MVVLGGGAFSYERGTPVQACVEAVAAGRLLLICVEPRVECYTKSMSLKYEPASEPLHISVK